MSVNHIENSTKKNSILLAFEEVHASIWFLFACFQREHLLGILSYLYLL